MNTIFISEAKKVWNLLQFEGNFAEDHFEDSLHNKARDFFHIGPFYYYVFDVRNFRFDFMSPQIKEVLGYEAHELDLGAFMSKIHPNDHSIFLNNEATVVDFFSKLPEHKLTKYKVSYDYRVQHKDGHYKRLLHQVVVLQHNLDKQILYTLGVHTDITSIKTSNISKLSFIGMEGEPSYHNVFVNETYSSSKSFFSKREKEILSFVMKGVQSTAIAQELSISKNTVDTHRKNISAKTNTKNVAELIAKIINEELL